MAVELLTFLGLAIVAEGILLALFPAALQRMMHDMAALAPERLRWLGVFAAVMGAVLLFALASFGGGSAETVGGLGFPQLRALFAVVS